MGEVRAKIVVQNLKDVHLCEAGNLKKDSIRTVELDVLADTGSVKILLPQDVVETLGLEILEKVIVTLANEEKIELHRARTILVNVCNRTWEGSCLVGPPRCEPLLGQIIMEDLDLVVHPATRTISVNPASPFLPSLKLK